MAAKKRKKKRPFTKQKKSFGFGALSIPASKAAAHMTHKELLAVAGSFAAGVVLTHVIGNNVFSVGSGAAIGITGAVKKNIYLSSLGLGMVLTTPASALAQNMNGLPEDEINGLSFKNFKAGAQHRIGTFFSSFKDKFQLPKKATPENGANGIGNIYPETFKQPNLAELDRLEQQIDNMNGLFGDDMPSNREY